MNISFHKFVLVFLHYFVSQSEAIELVYLDFYGESHRITSENYPRSINDEDVDIVWQCRPSIKLEINYFELDGQNGDFLMISDVPFDVDSLGTDFENLDPKSDTFINAILVSNGLLLSWAVNQTIQVHSEYGSFIYFHAQRPQTDGNRRQLFRGFDIIIHDYDALRTTTLRTTQEAEQTTPSPGIQIYLAVFLSCNKPEEFREEEKKNIFKEHLAEIASTYCNVTGYCNDCDSTQNCTPFKNFTINEVSIPDNGMFYCKREWPEFENCVEIRFAIVRSFANGSYIMTAPKLEDMWNRYSESLIDKGYCPFTPPGPEEIQPWTWIAFILGMILVLSALLWIIWIKISTEDFNKKSSSQRLKTSDDDNTNNLTEISDKTNPFVKFYKKWQSGRGADDAKYSEMVSELGNIVDADGSTVRQNQLYHRMQGAQDNHGYSTEEVEVEFERPVTYPPNNRFSPVDFMNITELDQENSDTEI